MPDNTIRNQIWTQIKTAFTYQLCVQRYISRKRKWNKIADDAILVCGILGSISYKLEETIPMYASWGVTVVALVKKSVPAFCQSESELNNLDEIMAYYRTQLEKLRCLWNKYEDNKINAQKANSELHKILKEEGEKSAQMNKLIRHLSNKENEFLEKETIQYLKSNYYSK